jgi:outer membrane protein
LNVTPTAANQRSLLDVGAAISVPIWDAGRTRAQENEARANLRNAEIQLEQIRKDVTADVQQAFLNLANARERTSASAVAVEAARANLAAATERFELNVRGISVVDLIEAQVQFNTANTNHIQAQFDVLLSQAQLERAIGQTPAVER